MDSKEIKRVLESFRIIVDTREQKTIKAGERFDSFGVPYDRATLDYGDYCADITLPDGSHLVDPSGRVSARCVVERKMSLDELAMCFGVGRDRFQREFQRAAERSARVFLLVEKATWGRILGGTYRSRINPNAFTASLASWMVRYNLQLIFCRPDDSGRLIKELLYWDIKERLRSGEFG